MAGLIIYTLLLGYQLPHPSSSRGLHPRLIVPANSLLCRSLYSCAFAAVGNLLLPETYIQVQQDVDSTLFLYLATDHL